MSGTPAAEFDVDAALVAVLLRDQHPDLADLPIVLFDSGWDNMMFRLGDTYCVRLPRRRVSAEILVHEQEWLPVLAPRLPLPVSVPVRIGLPAHSYPWRWSVLEWITGEAADLAPPLSGEAPVLAEFLRALHQPAPANAPVNPVRGCPLASRRALVDKRLARLRTSSDAISPAVDQAWQASLAALPCAEPRWVHGDLHARNVLTDGGQLCAIIDWGDLTAGDVATDLAGIWALFDDPSARAQALTIYGATGDQVARAKGWAVLFGAILLETGRVDNPRHAQMGVDTLRRVADDGPT